MGRYSVSRVSLAAKKGPGAAAPAPTATYVALTLVANSLDQPVPGARNLRPAARDDCFMQGSHPLRRTGSKRTPPVGSGGFHHRRGQRGALDTEGHRRTRVGTQLGNVRLVGAGCEGKTSRTEQLTTEDAEAQRGLERLRAAVARIEFAARWLAGPGVHRRRLLRRAQPDLTTARRASTPQSGHRSLPALRTAVWPACGRARNGVRALQVRRAANERGSDAVP
jgi:hypothetical protein